MVYAFKEWPYQTPRHIVNVRTKKKNEMLVA